MTPVEREALSDERLARTFHEAYERLAPKYGYATREDTREFDLGSANGKLMVAVCAEVRTILAASSDEDRRLMEQAPCPHCGLSRSYREQLTVGKLIAALERERGDWLVYIETDDGPKHAGTLGSYRGYYEQLAIGTDMVTQTVGQLLRRLRDQVGDTVTGYKGGTYRITEDTLVWAADYGECGPMIVGLDLRDDRVLLMTEVEE